MKARTQDVKTLKGTLVRLLRDRKVLAQQLKALTKEIGGVDDDIAATERALAAAMVKVKKPVKPGVKKAK